MSALAVTEGRSDRKCSRRARLEEWKSLTDSVYEELFQRMPNVDKCRLLYCGRLINEKNMKLKRTAASTVVLMLQLAVENV
ncbi:MAG: hypothetical protein LQ337_003449 [Flavoplaca oasis]|nr:MAG: hypothetical protein LQ337_003449 [Flavoplaca oasis]